jgi:hypothetical protein
METDIKSLKQELLNTRLSLEQPEVILSNLIKLNCPHTDKFLISNDDVLITIKTAIRILSSE